MASSKITVLLYPSFVYRYYGYGIVADFYFHILLFFLIGFVVHKGKQKNLNLQSHQRECGLQEPQVVQHPDNGICHQGGPQVIFVFLRFGMIFQVITNITGV